MATRGRRAHGQPGMAHARGQAEGGRVEQRSGRKAPPARLEVEAGLADIGAGSDAPGEADPAGLAGRQLLDRHRIGTGRHGSTR